MTESLRPAATLLLLRDKPSFEVLMIERNEDMQFAGGALAFPGGRIDEADADPAWKDVIKSANPLPDWERALRIGAIRETFEETGILLCTLKNSSSAARPEELAALGRHRGSVESDPAFFLNIVTRHDLCLDVDALTLFARWRTPPKVSAKRYDTWFFAARAPDGQTANADGGEAMHAMWLAPGDALKLRVSGERKMMFPTARNLELLDANNASHEVFRDAARRKIALVEPKVVERDGKKFIEIPDDLNYPVTRELLEKAVRN